MSTDNSGPKWFNWDFADSYAHTLQCETADNMHAWRAEQKRDRTIARVAIGILCIVLLLLSLFLTNR